jgi:hypothetical protein
MFERLVEGDVGDSGRVSHVRLLLKPLQHLEPINHLSVVHFQMLHDGVKLGLLRSKFIFKISSSSLMKK